MVCYCPEKNHKLKYRILTKDKKPASATSWAGWQGGFCELSGLVVVVVLGLHSLFIRLVYRSMLVLWLGIDAIQL